MSLSPKSQSLKVLATDLDGTLIPLGGNSDQQQDLRRLETELQHAGVALLFVTGRHLQSVQEVRKSHQLPNPQWIICDVGTSIYQAADSGELRSVEAYANHLQEIIDPFPIDQLKQLLSPIEGLTLQEQAKQGRFKLSYYTDAEQCSALAKQIQAQLDQHHAPYGIIASIDPFNNDGLIDLLPEGVSKAKALDWWAEENGHDPRSIIFAGDSGNDLAALCGGFRSIIVANADRSLVGDVQAVHRREGWNDRLFEASRQATSGVLEGFRHYLAQSGRTHSSSGRIERQRGEGS